MKLCSLPAVHSIESSCPSSVGSPCWISTVLPAFQAFSVIRQATVSCAVGEESSTT
jgi:hypothetical protein